MQQHHRSAALAGAVLLALVASMPSATAASQRTFVSTSGIDNPACSVGARCRTFGGALSVTNPGGEIVVLDSGGYGTVKIAHSISIIAPPGVYAGVSVLGGTRAGVEVAAQPGDDVLLRGSHLLAPGEGRASG